MNWLSDVGFFALLFFLLVFIHELGHFLMAKWMGIRVEKFSIGMGPSLFSFKKGDTEYRLAILPLGGYVKMAGDDPSKEYSEAERKVGFLTQSPPKKLLVVFGGPVFNLLLPIFLFGLMLATGIPTIRPIIGSIEPGMVAEKAGLFPGDHILSIDGAPISKWSQIESRIEKSADQKLDLKIERTNLQTGKIETIDMPVTPQLAPSKSKFGEDIQVGRLGISPELMIPLIFFDSTDSALAKAGLERMDRVNKIQGAEILSLEQLRKAFTFLKPGQVQFSIDRDGKAFEKTVELKAGAGSVESRLGFFPVFLAIGKTEANGPAAKAGLQTDDILISINGHKIQAWEDVAKLVRGSEGKPVAVKWLRSGKTMEASMTPEKTTIPDPLLGKDNPLARDAIYRIGISPAIRTEAPLSVEQSLNPIKWVSRGLTETWNMTSLTVQALTKLFTGQLSIKLLGSPIMIYKVAGNSYRMAGGGYFGWISFLSNLALLSITLGLVNLLPIPVLDGGHAVFFIIEWIRGRPVSLKVMEIAMQVGLFILVCVFGLVLFNDFSRYGWIDSILKVFK
ncbi:MAG: RIP metalloprotease RseP [Deltaproteobacteria bacterium]|nr:RIP metalloprotease RseP [Deltaproteobacteria bacterium]